RLLVAVLAAQELDEAADRAKPQRNSRDQVDQDRVDHALLIQIVATYRFAQPGPLLEIRHEMFGLGQPRLVAADALGHWILIRAAKPDGGLVQPSRVRLLPESIQTYGSEHPRWPRLGHGNRRDRFRQNLSKPQRAVVRLRGQPLGVAVAAARTLEL